MVRFVFSYKHVAIVLNFIVIYANIIPAYCDEI